MSKKTLMLVIVMIIAIVILAIISFFIIKNSNKSKESGEKDVIYSGIGNKTSNDSENKESANDNKKKDLSNNPYIPKGFTHVSGTNVDTGYIIIDENGNEFVWVPVSSGILTRANKNKDAYEDSDNTTTGFCNSVSKYYGFYISRYEASQTLVDGKDAIISAGNLIPWINVTYKEAYDAAYNMSKIYGYSDVQTSLVNSYAWEGTLKWINKTESNYSSNTSYGNYSGTILKTGDTKNDEINGICDLSGNVREWTTEIYYPEEMNSDVEEEILDENNTTKVENEYRVIRGGSASIKKSASSGIGQISTLSDAYWGFRVVMYK